MSDIFDHECDAYDSLNFEDQFDSPTFHYRFPTFPYRESLEGFREQDEYQQFTDFDVIHSTEKAVLYQIGLYEVWIPKSIHIIDDGVLLVQPWATLKWTRIN